MRRLFFAILAVAGFTFGISGFTFFYGQGYSYLSDDPKACVNCHVMRTQYDSWQRSPHRHVTTCNSCHSPENIFMKYFVKGENGLNHAFKFTTGMYEEPIQIRAHNFDIAMKACFKCHAALFEDTYHEKQLTQGRACVHCHKDVGHTH